MKIECGDDARNRRRTARAEAAAWIVRLHGPHRSPQLEEGFRAWLVADPENARQFERVTEAWERGATPVPGIARLGNLDNESGSQASRSPARRLLLAAAALLIVIGAGTWSAGYFWLNPAYSTRIGEQRVVRLTDGTRISLNSDTRVTVAYSDEARYLEIDRGEALFEVAKDPARPFIVTAGSHQVTALGTSFVVRYEKDTTAVTLVEGKVAVTPSSSSVTGVANVLSHVPPVSPPDQSGSARAPEVTSKSSSIITLVPGQRLVFSKTHPPTLDEPRLDTVTAWRRGEIVLDKTALADAVAEMNRYDQVALVIDDPAVAALKVSGIYHTGNSDAFAQMIAKLYGLEVVHRSGRIYLTSAASATLIVHE